MTFSPPEGTASRTVELLNSAANVIFQWTGTTSSEKAAVSAAHDAYGVVIGAVTTIMGSPCELNQKFQAERHEVRTVRSTSTWKVSPELISEVAWDFSDYIPSLARSEAIEFAREVIYSDKPCVRALVAGHTVAIDLSVGWVVSARRYAIEAIIALIANGRKHYYRPRNPAVVDALRAVAMHSLAVHTAPMRRPPNKPWLSCRENPPSSATLRAALRLRGTQRPNRLIAWLAQQEGCSALSRAIAGRHEY